MHQLESKDGIKIVKDGAHHKLIIHDCQERDAGKYKFEAEGRKSEATLIVEGTFVFYFAEYKTDSKMTVICLSH